MSVLWGCRATKNGTCSLLHLLRGGSKWEVWKEPAGGWACCLGPGTHLSARACSICSQKPGLVQDMHSCQEQSGQGSAPDTGALTMGLEGPCSGASGSLGWLGSAPAKFHRPFSVASYAGLLNDLLT